MSGVNRRQKLTPSEGSHPPDLVYEYSGSVGAICRVETHADLLALCEARYRARATTAHSDDGGDNTAMIKLNLAIAQARQELAA